MSVTSDNNLNLKPYLHELNKKVSTGIGLLSKIRHFLSMRDIRITSIVNLIITFFLWLLQGSQLNPWHLSQVSQVSVTAVKVLAPVDQLIYQMQMQTMAFWVKDCVNYCLLVSFAMYPSSVLVVEMNSSSADHKVTVQSLRNVSATLIYYSRHIEIVNWSPILSQISFFHIIYTTFGQVY